MTKQPTGIPFSQEIAVLEKGALDADATEALQEVTRAVMSTGRKGSVTVTLTIRPERNTENVLRIDAAVKTDIPAPGRPSSIRFGTQNGCLLRDDPAES